MGNNTDVFTSTEVAKICSVSNPTAIKWIDSGKLKGFRIPGSKARRVARKHLLAFMSKRYMPLEKLSCVGTRVLVIDNEQDFCKKLKREFDLDASFEVLIVSSAFRAGTVLREFKPEVILIDTHIIGIDSRGVSKFLRLNTGLRNVKVIGMSGDYIEESITGQDSGGFDGFLKKPFKFSELKETIQSLRINEANQGHQRVLSV